MSNALPPDYHATRLANAVANPGGVMGVTTKTSLLRPNTWATSVGHALVRGRNSPSSLNNTFGR